jgi:CO/xanthine dehydrogenase Mo-binding subunit
MTGLEPEDIRITGVQGSGCYGHNGADDAAADAAILAIAHPNHPIRVQFQREDEHQWEPYGSAMRMQLSATLEKDKIKSWNYQLWSDAHSSRPRGKAGHLLAGRYLKTPFKFDRPQSVGGGTRNSEPYYDIPQTEIVDHFVQGPLRTSALRSLGAYANIFAIESFVEELAEIAGIHPLEFRIRHLKDERAIQVIKVLQDAIEADNNQTGAGLGYGFSRYKNTAAYCAVATHLQVDLENKSILLLKMWAVLDAGEAINIDGLKNQTSGGMIQSASWTLREEVQFDPHEIISRDWTRYPILRYPEIPQTEVIIINHPELPPLGAGEAAQGPAAASIANAIYSACGKRVRDLPIEKTLFL